MIYLNSNVHWVRAVQPSPMPACRAVTQEQGPEQSITIIGRVRPSTVQFNTITLTFNHLNIQSFKH